MAIDLEQTGTDVTHDESASLQNTGIPIKLSDLVVEDNDDDDTDASLPTAFSAQLTALGLDASNAIGRAVSDGNVISITDGASLTDLAFTDEDGNPLNGDSSGLFTVDGDEIFLFTDDEDNNIILGKDGDGNVAFALYLEETGGPPPTGANVWILQFDALAHEVDGGPTDGATATESGAHDDALDLTNKVYVTASEDVQFSLANAPSGQNLFINFGETSVSIVVTGRDPANQSEGESITSGDTVNTSQGGGSTTFGVNNQMFDPGEGAYFTFVTNSPEGLIVPNLDQNEADLESNIQFDDMFDATAAQFKIAQTQPASPSVSVMVKLTAYTTDAEPGTDFVDGLGDADDVQVDITEVRVLDGAGNEITSGISIVEGVATVSGLRAGYTVQYETTDVHNRLLLENAATTGNLSFDIGEFQLQRVGADTEEVGSQVRFEDDGPTAGIALDEGTVTHDETAGLDGDADDTDDTDVADLFSVVTNPSTDLDPAGFAQGTAAAVDSTGSSFGTDGAGTIVFSLDVSSPGVDSGLMTTDGTSIFLFKEGDLVVGRIDDADGDAVFAVAIDGETGVLSVAQYASLFHGVDTDPDDSVSIATGALQAVVTVTDGDGDTDSASTDIGDKVSFEDDAPTVAASSDGGTVTHDETAGVDTDADDTTDPTVSALFSGVTDPSADLTPAGFAQGTAAVIDVDSGTGEDDEGATTVFSLDVSSPGVDSGLTTTDGTSIFLFKEGDLVVGRIDDADGDAAFAVAIDSATGVLSLAQYASLFHGVDTDPDDTVSIATEALQATATITDGDGDTDTDSVGIGDKVSFEDDGPTAAIARDAGTVTHDETAGLDGDADDIDDAGVAALFSGVTNPSTDLSAAGFAQGSAAAVNSTGSSSGEDDEGATTVFSLDVSSAGVDSGLDTTDGTSVLLFKENGLIVGRIGSQAGAAAFAVAIDGATGVLSVAQYASLFHDDDTDHDDPVSITNTALQAVVTVTDGDGDTDTASVGIGDKVSFEDDGPAVTVENLSGSFTTEVQSSAWTDEPGEDGFKSLEITLDSYTIGDNPTVDLDPDESLGTQTGPFPLVFNGSITDDFTDDGIDNEQTVEFTLTFNDDNTYEFEVTSAPSGVTTISTAGGSLDAGGPDPVRTLSVDTNTIVFSAVNPTADPTLIQDFLDEDEATIEADAEHLSAGQMNVSTAGIGLANNNFDGNADSGVDGNTTAGGKVDESFVIDPHFLVSSMKVFIDNSVGGYNTTNEELYYRVYDSEGNVGDITLVTAADLTPETGRQVSFVVGDPDAPSNIDAVQLFMGTGTVKIPVIEFTVTDQFDPLALEMDFTATLVDGDDDSSSDPFTIDLETEVG